MKKPKSSLTLRNFLEPLSPADRETFAKRCGTSVGHLKNIAYGYKPCGASLAINVDRESGGKVRCETQRPDVDWQYLRNSK